MWKRWFGSSYRVQPYRSLNDNIADNVIVLPFTSIVVTIVLLPLMAFFLCVFWSLVFDFETSTSTHCGVRNFLPSISAAIGAFSPQKYIWRLAIGLHSMARYVIAYMYYNRFDSKLVFTLNVTEITALLGLTYVSSTENFSFHSKAFVTFLLTAFMGMVLHLIKYKRSKFKKYMTILNVSAALLAVYFYLRHNNYCETGVYTLFAICEYLVVLSNMLFHFQAYYDFNQIVIAITDRRYHSINYAV
ncbi:post-GPI attachment to proteins factor 2-like [Oppia nitens]|uniref:post-GPI attachment to proteins factor 2-like n=1 Tax=Oppia nitens TaxID=1686743 RepID=UPI0023DB7944|nr:post-GPI attachment to proteins factor 2-like [Oppia nitens]